MNKNVFALGIGTVMLTHAACYAIEPGSLEQFVRQRGWKSFELKDIARSPTPDITPVIYYEKEGFAQSCGLIITAPSAKEPRLIELTGPEEGTGWPQCLNIGSMVPFKLHDRDYISVEFIQRDTREESYRHYVYIYRDTAKGYVTDEDLSEVVPDRPTASKPMDGVRFGRTNYLAKAFSKWRFLSRDFISDKGSSFAVFEDKKTQQCYFVAESGGAPMALSNVEFAPGTKCVETLASSRLDKAGTVYYLAMFKSDKGAHVVGVTSVSQDGQVTAEKALSYALNRSSRTKDIKSAKAALAEALR
jgi:hypothetical protein